MTRGSGAAHDIGDGRALAGAKAGFALGREERGHALPARRDDHLVGVDEGTPELLGAPRADDRLPGPHQADEHEVSTCFPTLIALVQRSEARYASWLRSSSANESPPNFRIASSASTSATMVSATTPAAGTAVTSVRSLNDTVDSFVSTSTVRNTGRFSVANGFIAHAGDEQVARGHPTLGATGARRLAPVRRGGVVPQDLVVCLAPTAGRDVEAVAHLDALHRLDAHERLREPAVDAAVPVHVRPEPWRDAVPEHLEHPAERVSGLRRVLDRRDHPGFGLGVEAAHRRLVDGVEIGGLGPPIRRCAHRAEGDHVAQDLHAEPRQQLLRERAGRDARRGLARAGSLEHVAGVVEAVLLHAHEVGVSRPRLTERALRGAGSG